MVNAGFFKNMFSLAPGPWWLAVAVIALTFAGVSLLHVPHIRRRLFAFS